MNYRIHDTVNPTLESIFIIEVLVNGEGVRERMEEMKARFPDATQEIEAIYHPVLTLMEEIAAQFDASDEAIHLIFRRLDELDGSPSYVFRKMQEEGPTAESALRAFAHFLNEGDDELIFPDERAFFDYVDAMPIRYELKAILLMVYLQRERLYEVYDKAVAEVRGLLEARLPRMADLITTFVSNFRERVEALGFNRLMQELEVPIELRDAKDIVYDIYPQLTHNEALSLVDTDLLWGIDAIALLTLKRREAYSTERALEVIKVIADKTKFEILRILGRETLYGTELAERLGLSAATISHHIGQLTSYRLVNIIKQGNRIYYRTNQETLTHQLDLIARALSAPEQEAQMLAKA